MSRKNSFLQLKADLISIGFAFYGEPSAHAADPERTLLGSIELFSTERKSFVMLLAWLEKVRDLVHVERLKSMMHDLDPGFLPVFGAVCLKQLRSGDRRFAILITAARHEIDRRKIRYEPRVECDAFLVSKHGVDEEFLEFGIRTPLIAPADPKKILSVEGILKRNSWLRMRALIGPNFRADIAYLMAARIVGNAHQASKTLGCNAETAYRLWRTLEIAPDLAKLAS